MRKETSDLLSVNELIEYEGKIDSLIKKASPRLIFNESAVHATLITTGFLNNASSINMYCGEFSIFRKDFKDEISEELKKMKENNIVDNSEHKNFDPYQKSIDALEKFFAVRKGQMNVITQKDITKLIYEPVWNNFLWRFHKNKQLVFYKYFNEKLELFHFTVADNKMYRQESDAKNRTAFACFNDEESSSLLNTSFAILKKDSEVIDLS